MLEQHLYQKLLQFITKCIDDDSVIVIIANQKSPVTKKPFITVKISSLIQEGQVIKHNPRIDESFNKVQDFTYVRNANIKVQSFCDNIFQPAFLLEKIRMGFDLNICYSIFEKEIAYVRNLSDIIILPTLLPANQEYRASYEFVLRYNQTITNAIDSITHIEITDEVSGEEIIIDKSIYSMG